MVGTPWQTFKSGVATRSRQLGSLFFFGMLPKSIVSITSTAIHCYCGRYRWIYHSEGATSWRWQPVCFDAVLTASFKCCHWYIVTLSGQLLINKSALNGGQDYSLRLPIRFCCCISPANRTSRGLKPSRLSSTSLHHTRPAMLPGLPIERICCCISPVLIRLAGGLNPWEIINKSTFGDQGLSPEATYRKDLPFDYVISYGWSLTLLHAPGGKWISNHFFI